MIGHHLSLRLISGKLLGHLIKLMIVKTLEKWKIIFQNGKKHGLAGIFLLGIITKCITQQHLFKNI